MLFTYPFHPRLVHFPIALTLVGAAFYIWGILRGQERWLAFGRTSLVLGWIGILVAIVSGLIDQSRAPNLPAVADTINQHITVGIAMVVVFGLALYWPLRDRKLWTQPGKRWAFVALLCAGAGLVLLEGWLGGKLVYQLGVGVAGH